MSGEPIAHRAARRPSMKLIRRASGQFVVLAAALAFLALSAPGVAQAEEDPALQPPFGGSPVPKLVSPESRNESPPGFVLSAREAVRIANGTEVVIEELVESPAMRGRAFTRGADRWQVSYFDDGTEVAQVLIDDRSGEVQEAYRDHQVSVKLARGYEDAVSRNVNEAWIWLPLAALFLAPFIDPRRPFRLVHLDLLVLLGFSVSHFFLNKGQIDASVPLVYPALAYLFVRMLLAGFRPREQSGPLIPFAPIQLLIVGAVGLAVFRIVLNIVDSSVIDVGVAGVVGADLLTSGADVYGEEFAPGIDLRGDTYGPFTYIVYAPFEWIFPWEGVWDSVPAAHAAAITFDLLIAATLFLLGWRLRAGQEGLALGVALSYAWLAFPYSLYALGSNVNDGLVALMLAVALLVLTWAPAGGVAVRRGATALRGVAIALGAAAKFGPLALAPLFAAGTGERRWRSVLPFALAFAVVWAVVLIPLLPDGGPREFYDRTFGFQAGRGSPFSIWGLAPSLDWLQTLARVFAVGFGLALFFVPKRRTLLQIAALGAAALIATQIASQHWFYFFIVWFAPYVLVTVFGSHRLILGNGPGTAGAAAATPPPAPRLWPNATFEADR